MLLARALPPNQALLSDLLNMEYWRRPLFFQINAETLPKAQWTQGIESVTESFLDALPFLNFILSVGQWVSLTFSDLRLVHLGSFSG